MAVPAPALAPSLPSAAALPGLTPALDGSAGARTVEFEAVLAAQLGLSPTTLPADVAVEPGVEDNVQTQTPAPAPQAETAPLDPLTAALAGIPAPVPIPPVPVPAVAQLPQSAGSEVLAPLPTVARHPVQVALSEAVQEAADPPAPATGTPGVAAAPATIAGSPDREAPLPAPAHDIQAAAVPADGPEQPESRSDLHPVSHERPHEAPRRIDNPPADAPVRLGARNFADDVGQRVMWMASSGRQAAELRLDPPHLGPVEVRLTLAGDQATLTLLSPHASVRDALQTSLPRLQEMLVSAGIDLGSVHVGSHAPGGDAGSRAWHGSSEHAGAAWLAGSPAAPGAAAPVKLGRGLIDTYA
jgi:flagellar hook-length control protein FliK